METATELKEKGNKAFRAGDYTGALQLYSKAISRDPRNPILFTNRAFACIKLEQYDNCINDCIHAIELDKRNMKAYYYLAQAQIGLNHPNEAVSSALTAYDICLRTRDSSTPSVAALILRAKKLKWEAAERERVRRSGHLVAELESGVRSGAERELQRLEAEIRESPGTTEGGVVALEEEKQEVLKQMNTKIDDVRNAFAIADTLKYQNREVPDYMIDNISFNFMHDPVITKSGQSYERSTIELHLKTSNTDPLTREPLRQEDLRPNLALKQACDEFLKKNGWAVDW